MRVMLCCRHLLTSEGSSTGDGGQVVVGTAEVRPRKVERLVASLAPQTSSHVLAEAGPASTSGAPALAPEAGVQTARLVCNIR